MTARYLTVATCAVYIGRTEHAIRHLVKQGAIPHIKLGRRVQFDPVKLDAWMSRHGRRGAIL